jgi:hypothetical protein
MSLAKELLLRCMRCIMIAYLPALSMAALANKLTYSAPRNGSVSKISVDMGSKSACRFVLDPHSSSPHRSLSHDVT